MIFSVNPFLSFLQRNWFSVILTFIWFAVLGAVVYQINKGFDITDEGFYLLSLKHPEETYQLVTSWHRITSRLIGGMDLGVVGYRILRLLFVLSSGIFFAYAFWRWLLACFDENAKRYFGSFYPVVLFTSLGGMLGFTGGPPGFSYNIMNDFFILLALAFFFLWFCDFEKSDAASGLKRHALIGLSGFSVSFDFFVKPSSGVLLGSFLLFVIIVCSRRNFKSLVQSFVSYGFGIMLGCMVFFIFFCPFNVWYENLFISVKWLGGNNYVRNMGHDYWYYFSFVIRYFIANLLFVFPVVIAVTAVSLWVRSSNAGPIFSNVFRAILFVLFSIFIYYAYRLRWHESGSYGHGYVIFIYMTTLVLAALIVLTCRVYGLVTKSEPQKQAENTSKFCVALLLAAVPFFGVAGTDTIIMTVMTYHLTAWFGLIALLLFYVMKRFNSPALFQAVALVLSFFVLVQDVFVMSHPYRLTVPVKYQDKLIYWSKPLRSLKVDQYGTATLALLTSTVMRKTNFKTGDPVLALYDMPGLVYFLEGVSPVIPWYRDDHICKINDRKTKLDLKRAIIIKRGEIKTDAAKCLQEAGVNYPDGYEMVADIPFAYANVLDAKFKSIQVLKPKS